MELRAMEGKLHAANGRLAQAATSYQAAIALGDTRTQTALALARCLLESGEARVAADARCGRNRSGAARL